MKKVFTVLFVLLTITSITANLYAANQRDGKRKFKKYCHKKCHSGKKANIPYITPSTYTAQQWKIYFNNNLQKLKEVHKNGELNKIKLKPKHYRNIEAFLMDHALGAFEPESCTQ